MEEVGAKRGRSTFMHSQFLLSGLHGDGKWIVPITVCCGSYSTQKSFLLQTESKELVTSEVMGSPNTQSCFQEKGDKENWDKNNSRRLWVILNVDQTGFYRVKYDDELAARLKFAVEAGQLSATDRFGYVGKRHDKSYG